MASSLRMAAPKMASMAAQSSVKVARSPMMKSQQLQKFSRAYSATTRTSPTAFNTIKRTSTLLSSARSQLSPIATRAYSSEMANAMVQVSQNMGMGNAAIGLGGAGIGIGLVFAALLSAVARNPSMRGQLFSYAILGFAFVEAIGLFDLMVAMMCKYV
ncbi:ATPase complex subunit 9 [Friedmanniomyces endolithicus]|uniref:ATP synthase subunit 9, mitochondrial n=1 Tax=Friedmanniomyces endolithicus TaxID=329885 RepID=A0AAN6KZB8_9PEZI|nr:ATPase complex subunit 9 [Friedmanniomyces endolithicus]KAK0300095.1 ATPase complex subunit 9 [Friedmanniomyces endolithicus]KAK0325102.1 ATPase complex subunit 9 [Friedmanniomyces endolithicus]KAK0927775.1 ATPase complex subunit 9 [Friedmanniomyces endolithicus]KAK0937317.1 ATPase complex subunit 9 [Friedmanniomyces endolithicus]